MDSDLADSSLKFVTTPKLTFEAKADFDNKIFPMVSKDSIMLSDMNKAVTAFYDDEVCGELRKKLKAFDKLIEVMFDNNAELDKINKQLDGLNNAIERDKELYEKGCQQVIDKVWKNYQKKKDEYLKYKVDVTLAVAGSMASIGASFIGGLSSAPLTGGATAVLAIIGIAKAVVRIAREAASYWQSVETSIKLLTVQFQLLEKLAATTLGRKANEYTAALATEFFGVAEPSIKSCKQHLDAIKGKMAGIEVKLHDAGIELNDLLDKQDELRKAFMKDVESRLAKHPGGDARAQAKKIEAALDKEIAPSRAKVVDQIEAVGKANESFKGLDKAVDELLPLQKKLQELADKRDIDERIVRLVLSFAHAKFDFDLAVAEGLKSTSAIASAVAPLGQTVFEELKNKATKDTYLERN